MLIVTALFMLFGVIGVRPYYEMQSTVRETVEGGIVYSQICCLLTVGVFLSILGERLLQATGRTVGRILTLLQVQQLFRIDLGIFVLHGLAAVTDGNEGEAHFIKLALAVVGDVPAQAAVPDLVILVALGFPFLRGKVAERRQVAVIFLAHGFQLTKSLVDFGTLHSYLSFT